MRGSDGTPARGRWPRGLFGMIALIVAVESYVASRGPDFDEVGASSWRIGGRAAREEGPNARVLCLGDSLVKMGVVPQVLEQRLGLPAYNLAICGAQPPATYFLLRRALEGGAHPAAVLVDFKPNMMAGGPRDWVRTWPEMASLRETTELALAARDATFFAAVLVRQILPSARLRDEIRGNIREALRGDPTDTRARNLGYWRNWQVNRGGQLSGPNTMFDGHVSEAQHKSYMSHVWWCDRINRAYIHKFLELAARHNIPVFWLLPPIAPEVQRRREQTGSDAKHTEFVRAFQKRYANLIVVDGRHSGYDARRFNDPVHLARDGALAYTADVAAIVARYLTRAKVEPRWAFLPPYHDGPSAPHLEDLDQSRVVVKQQGAVRR